MGGWTVLGEGMPAARRPRIAVVGCPWSGGMPSSSSSSSPAPSGQRYASRYALRRSAPPGTASDRIAVRLVPRCRLRVMCGSGTGGGRACCLCCPPCRTLLVPSRVTPRGREVRSEMGHAAAQRICDRWHLVFHAFRAASVVVGAWRARLPPRPRRSGQLPKTCRSAYHHCIAAACAGLTQASLSSAQGMASGGHDIPEHGVVPWRGLFAGNPRVTLHAQDHI